MRRLLMDRDAAAPRFTRPERPDRTDVQNRLDEARDRLGALRDAVAERREALDALKAAAGDPGVLEPADLDASDAFAISASEDGMVVLTTPSGARETPIAFSEETDSFEALAALRGARKDAATDAFDALKALSGEPDALEAGDLDASDAFSVTQSEDGDVVLTTPRGARETRVPFSEDTDSFTDLADAAREAHGSVRPGPQRDADDAASSLRFGWGLRDRLAERSAHSDAEAAPAAEPAPTSMTADDFTGAGQTVVVIDSGYSLSYDQSATVYEYDFEGWRNDRSAQTSGVDSHGSWVAQTVINEAEGVEIIHLKVADETGQASLWDIQEALDFVVARAEVDDIAAVNLSMGFGAAEEETRTLLSDEFADLDALGVFSIVAAGNGGQTYDGGVNVLAADANVIGVSAVDDDGAFASFSQTDDDLTDIAALGVDVGVETIDGDTFDVSGTSFAAPQIAGVAARLQEAALATIGETLTDEEFVAILQASGDAVVGAPEADGYKVADGDAAVEYFLANADTYGDLLIA